MAAAVATLAAPAAADAEESTAPAPPAAAAAETSESSPLRAGAWAMEFELDPEYQYDLGIQSSAVLSAKRFLSKRAALRAGIGAGFSDQKSDGDGSIEEYRAGSLPPYSSSVVTTDRVYETHSYTAFVHYMRYGTVRHRLVLHWEAGPSFRYSEYEDNESRIYPELGASAAQSASYEYLAVRRGVSLDILAGFEWFFSKRLSLGARIGFWGGYVWGETTESREYAAADGSYFERSTIHSDTENVRVQTNPATVLFSAYF